MEEIINRAQVSNISKNDHLILKWQSIWKEEESIYTVVNISFDVEESDFDYLSQF